MAIVRALLVIAVGCLSIAASSCPPVTGIYLMYNEFCLPDNAQISNMLVNNASIKCGFANSTQGGTGGGGESMWTGPEVAINCSSQSCILSNASNVGNYTCTHSGANITVLITNNTIVQAIYTEPPSNISTVPQNYTVHCLADCGTTVNITSENTLNTLISSLPNTTTSDQLQLCNYSVTVQWNPNVSYSGNPMWKCEAQRDNITESLQTYIRVPATAPSGLTLNTNDTILSWTPLNGVCGYVVYAYTLMPLSTDEASIKEVTTSMYPVLQDEDLLVVRGYSDLLGPASQITEKVTINNLTWTLLSDRGSLQQVNYTISWDVEYLLSAAVEWRENGLLVKNNATHIITNISLEDDMYRHSLTVSVVNITSSLNYSAVFNGGNWRIASNSIVVRVPTKPPTILMVIIMSKSEICVHWTPLESGAADGYVIVYEDNMSKNTTVVEGESISQYNISGLSSEHYTISMVAYLELSSQLSESVEVWLKAPGPVSDIKISSPQLNNHNVSWSQPMMADVTNYSITSQSLTCPIPSNTNHSTNQWVVVMLLPGQNYNITVQANNALGSSMIRSKEYTTPTRAPNGVPVNVTATVDDSSSYIFVEWMEIPCMYRNGEITGYTVMYKSTTDSRQRNVSTAGFIVTIPNLEPGKYRVSVAGMNADGLGPCSKNISVIIIAQPPTDDPMLVLAVGISIAVVGVLVSVLVIVVLLVIVIRSKLVSDKSLVQEDSDAGYYDCTELKVLNAVDPHRHTDDTPSSTIASQSDSQFQHGIPTINKVTLDEMSEYVSSCHAHNNTEFSAQFQKLYTGSEKLVSVGFSEKNRTLNRFVNITTYNDNRVILKPIGTYQHDFVNASYIDGFFTSKKFIACQGPMKHTLVDMWRLVWQERCRCIVMVTNLMDAGKAKCEQYWPTNKQKELDVTPFIVKLTSEIVLPDYIIRSLMLSLKENPDDCLTVTHYQFTSWPDHGVPEYGTPLMMLHKRVIANWSDYDPPLLVHCSAGVGRTGTFIAIDLALDQVKEENAVDITGIVTRLRQQRMMMVQSERQYMFIHDAILEKITCGETEVPTDGFTAELAVLKQLDTNNKYKLQDQFELLSKVTRSPNEGWFATALSFPDKNRTNDYLPNENWRVPLKHSSRYIHASFVNGYREKKTFIIAQSPLENTVEDFLRMVVDYKVAVIVMLCCLEEDETISQYWPDDEWAEFGEFTVRAQLVTAGRDGVIRRNLKVQAKDQEAALNVVQLHIKSWPSSGIVKNISMVLSVMESVQAVCRKTGGGPVILHCSDTVSRSALYCVISNVLEQCKAEGVVDVFQAVKGVRVQKPGAITTQEQYDFIFEVVVVFLRNYANYSNFGFSL